METIAVAGLVATRPRHLVTADGLSVTSFRLVTRPSRGEPGSWYTVSAFRRLALSVAECVARGDPVLVAGMLRIRDWLGERPGATAEIIAEAVGHDLAWGRSRFEREVDAAELAAVTAHDGSSESAA